MIVGGRQIFRFNDRIESDMYAGDNGYDYMVSLQWTQLNIFQIWFCDIVLTAKVREEW